MRTGKFLWRKLKKYRWFWYVSKIQKLTIKGSCELFRYSISFSRQKYLISVWKICTCTVLILKSNWYRLIKKKSYWISNSRYIESLSLILSWFSKKKINFWRVFKRRKGTLSEILKKIWIVVSIFWSWDQTKNSKPVRKNSLNRWKIKLRGYWKTLRCIEVFGKSF